MRASEVYLYMCMSIHRCVCVCPICGLCWMKNSAGEGLDFWRRMSVKNDWEKLFTPAGKICSCSVRTHCFAFPLRSEGRENEKNLAFIFLLHQLHHREKGEWNRSSFWFFWEMIEVEKLPWQIKKEWGCSSFCLVVSVGVFFAPLSRLGFLPTASSVSPRSYRSRAGCSHEKHLSFLLSVCWVESIGGWYDGFFFFSFSLCDCMQSMCVCRTSEGQHVSEWIDSKWMDMRDSLLL